MTRILVRPPALEDLPSWRALGWRAEPDPIGLADEQSPLVEPDGVASLGELVSLEPAEHG